MDPFTQRLMERTRQRREELKKKMMETETSPKRKRSIPLGENQSENVQKENTNESDDSPNKRYCLREEENSIKCDTPAIPSVRSRLGTIGSHYGDNDDEYSNNENAPMQQNTNEAIPSLAFEEPEPVQIAKPKPGRRTRLAALAANINKWEDDLSQPSLKKEEKPKKVWQPPPPVETVEEPAPNKPPRTFEHPESKSPMFKVSPFKSQNKVEVWKPSPTKESPVKTMSPLKSQITVQLNTTPSTEKVKSSVSATKLNSASWTPSAITQSSPSRRAGGTPVKGITMPDVKATVGDDKKEPTEISVSSRLAAWQNKTSDGNNTKGKDPAEQSVTSRMSAWQEKSKENNTPFKPPTGAIPKKAIPGKLKKRYMPSDDEDPLNMSIHSRMANWEHKVTKSIEEENVNPARKAVTPLKMAPPKSPSQSPLETKEFKQIMAQRKEASGAQDSPQKSPIKSPSKCGAATKSIHERLASIQDNWKSNDITDKLKKERQADLEALQNRWKDGVLKESSDVTETKTSCPPVPPPLPPTATPSPKKTQKIEVTQAGSKSAPHPMASKKTERREQARDKLRSDFENKLKAMGFDMNSDVEAGHVASIDLTPFKEKQKREMAEKMGNTPVAKTGITVTTPGQSIYSLIKKNQSPGNGSSQYDIPSRAAPAPASSTEDSFDSSSSFSESSTAIDEVDMAQPMYQRSGMNRYRSGTSLQSDYSDETSDYSQTDDYTETEGDYTADDYSVAETTETEGYSDDDLDETEADNMSDINNFLDEAMDSTTCTETDLEMNPPTAAPRRHRPTSSHYPTQSVIRDNDAQRRLEASQNRVTWHQGVRGGNSTTTISTTSSGLSSTESESDDSSQVYTMEMYRSSNRGKQSAPTMTIVRHSEHSQRPQEQEEELPYIPEKSVKERLQELQDLVNQEQSVIMQTSNALNQCCGLNSTFAGSLEAVECHRLLLIACKKREEYLAEMQRLRDGTSTVGNGGKPQGSVTISDIRLPLKGDFMSKIGTAKDTTVHYFMCMLRHKGHVIVTQMISTHDAMVRGSLDFPNLIKINDITEDFKIELEVYGMSVTKEAQTFTPKKKSKGLTPKKWFKGAGHSAMQSPGGPLAVRTTNFTYLSSLSITKKSLNKIHFNLERIPFSSPLQGAIHLRLRCLMESNIEERGFLTMFEDVSGFGAWHRRWFVLQGNRLAYWKYPDDEKYKDPMGSVDLKQCITDVVGLIPRDICARPNTFELATVRRQSNQDKDTLVTRCYNTMTTSRHMLSADTKDDRLIWCERLNEALVNLRAWHADALRPIKRQQKDSY